GAAGTLDGDQVGLAVAVAVHRRHAGAAAEARVEGEEAFQQRAAVGAEGGDVGAAAGAGDDVGPAVAVDVAGADVDAAGVGGVEGEETAEARARGAAEDGDVGPPAGSRAGDDVGPAVAVG